MPVEAGTSEFTYLGDGVTKTFPFPARFFTAADITAWVDGIQQAPSSYSVAGAGVSTGGAVTFTVAPVSGAKVTLINDPQIIQPVDFVTGQTVLEGILDNALDRLTVIAQRLAKKYNSALRLSSVGGDTVAEIAATPAERAQKILSFDTAGNPVAITNNAVAAKASEDAANAAKVAAQAAQTAAENARDQTLSAYDSFDDRYLGAKAANPTVDNDGNALVGGALYYDTVAQRMRLWTGSQWIDAYVAGSASGILLTPVGNITATDVQTGISQIDSALGLRVRADIGTQGLTSAQKANVFSNLDLGTSARADAAFLVPTGAIMPFAMATPPTGWLKANGAAISRTNYSLLFNALVTSSGFTSKTFSVSIGNPAIFTYSGHGFIGGERLRLSTTGGLPAGLLITTDYFVEVINTNTFYLLSSIGGSRVNTSGTQSGSHSFLQSYFGLGDGSTTFNLPDLRGEFLRGWDDGRGVDSSRLFGSFQNHDFLSHSHSSPLGSFLGGNGANQFGSAGQIFGYSLTTNATGGTETRPRNIALLACIKY
jgi:phage-related tail fiber protein